jgi:transposase InsO family protein
MYNAREAWLALAAIYEPKSRARIGFLRKQFVLNYMLPHETMAKYLSRVQGAVADLMEAGKDVPEDDHAYQIICGLSSEWDSVVERLYALSDAEFIPRILKERLLNEYERRNMSLQPFSTEHLSGQSAALQVDHPRGVRGRGRGGRRRRGRFPRNASRPPADQQQQSQQGNATEVVCYSCGGRGHYSRECPSGQLSRGSRGTNPRGRRRVSPEALFVEAEMAAVSLHSEWALDSAATHHFCRVREWFSNFRSISMKPAVLAEGTTPIHGIGDIHLIVQVNGSSIQVILKDVLFAPRMKRNLISGRILHQQGNRFGGNRAGIVIRSPQGKTILPAPLVNNFFIVTAEISSYEISPGVPYGEALAISTGSNVLTNKGPHPQLLALQAPGPSVTPTVQVPETVSVSSKSTQRLPKVQPSEKKVSQENKVEEVPKAVNKKTDDLDLLKLWHARLGHIAFPSLVKLSRSNKVRGMPVLKGGDVVCDPCRQGKATHAPHPKGSGRSSSAILDLIHSDVWGPSSVASCGGARYYISFTDDFTRKSFVYVMKNKSQAFEKFKEFLARAERSTGLKVKRLRIDNGMEYCAQYFQSELVKLGIKCERTNIYQPQMNGLAERLNRTLMDSVRTMLVEAKLSSEWWAELVTVAAYLKNKSPHSGIGGEIPDALFYGLEQPSLLHLRRIGS